MEFTELRSAIIEGNAKAAEELTQAALSQKVNPLVIVNEGLVPAMGVVGEKFKNEEYYMPDMLVSARAMKTAMALLKPLLSEIPDATLGRVVIGTVKGDLHDIGKNLVAMMLEGAGFEVIDLGIDVAPETFVNTSKEQKPQLICLSALLTTTMPMIGTTIQALKDAEVRDQVKVLIGGAPVTDSYASQAGADGYAPEAASAVDRAKEVLGIATS